MDSIRFQETAIRIAVDHYNDRARKHGRPMIQQQDIVIVWSSKTLQNNKIILSTRTKTGLLFEITYNGDKQEAYIDTYQKIDNASVQLE